MLLLVVAALLIAAAAGGCTAALVCGPASASASAAAASLKEPPSVDGLAAVAASGAPWPAALARLAGPLPCAELLLAAAPQVT